MNETRLHRVEEIRWGVTPESAIKEPRGSLVDPHLENARDPQLFMATSKPEETRTIKPRDFLKIDLNPDPNSKGLDEFGRPPAPTSFWVEVVERRGISGFVVKIANDIHPAFALKHGDLIIVAEHHVRDIERGG